MASMAYNDCILVTKLHCLLLQADVIKMKNDHKNTNGPLLLSALSNTIALSFFVK